MRNGLAGTGRGDAARKALQRRSGFFMALAASTALVAVPAMATPAPTIEELAGGGGGQGGYDSTLGQGAAGAGGAAGPQILRMTKRSRGMGTRPFPVGACVQGPRSALRACRQLVLSRCERAPQRSRVWPTTE